MSSTLAFRPILNQTVMLPLATQPQLSTITTRALPSNPSSRPRPAKKRKHGRHSQEVKVPSKRRKAIGRPKNDWTQTRLRKLVRLYLLTDLEVGEITKILWRKDFHPCPRDVQKKLELLLQPRPNQLRQKKRSSRSRLEVLEECRRLHRSWRDSKSQNIDQTQQLVDKRDMPWNSSKSILVPQDEISSGWWQWMDEALDQYNEVYDQPIDYMAPLTASSIPEDTRPRITSISTLPEDDFIPGLALSDFGPDQTQGSSQSREPSSDLQIKKHTEGPEISQSNNSLSDPESRSTKMQQVKGGLSVTATQNCINARQLVRNFSRPFVQSKMPPLLSSATITDTGADVPHPKELSILVEDYDSIQSHAVLVLNNTTANGPLGEYSGTEKSFSEDQDDIKIRVSMGGRSSQGSFLSIASLNRRLSSKYSQSDLQKIRSVMRLTVPRSSALFKMDERSSNTSSRKGSRAFLRQLELRGDHPIQRVERGLRQQYDPPVVLPGVFHTFCTVMMRKGSLKPCRRDGVCEHYDPDMRRFFVNKPSQGDVIKLWRIKRSINNVDQFGNTILHVAASLPLPVRYIIKLINQNANTNAINLAGQTFLHLLRAPNEADDVCLLLEMLSINGFNFLQQDQNGRSSLHYLLSPSTPRQYRKKITKRIISLGLVNFDIRDNQGFTLFGLMDSACSQLFGIIPSTDLSLGFSAGDNSMLSGLDDHPNTCEVFPRAEFSPRQPKFQQGSRDLVHTQEDVQRYYHADLLRTIVKAGENPSFEDCEGRNGIHCLAEVLIDLPRAITASAADINRTSPSSSSASSPTPIITKREQYLHNLLVAGVNPNSHDKHGMTPLMAFIIHTRHHRILGEDGEQEEDDDTTMRLLTLLLNAKADINRRNSNGETALHLAVMLGRRAATKCLLARGANVHARNSQGQGVVDIGMRAWNEAGRKAGGADDERLYARIMLCLCLAVSLGAVSEPSVLQEWTSSTAERSAGLGTFLEKRQFLEKGIQRNEERPKNYF